jgi:6-phosphogluconolactonase
MRNITASLAVGQGAACWVAVSPSGRFAYTGNASGSISGFGIGHDGALSALTTTALVPSPRDLAFDESGGYLYAVSPGSTTTGGLVTSYRVGQDGSLTPAGTAAAAAGITGAAAS